MKVIALIGKENTGKSHTINIVYSFLLRDGYLQVSGHFRELGNPRFEDFIDILIQEGKMVGIVGMGDYQIGKGKSLKSLLEELRLKGCHVAICACRTIPNLVSVVSSYPSHVIINKTLSSGAQNHRIVNVLDANVMISHT